MHCMLQVRGRGVSTGRWMQCMLNLQEKWAEDWLRATKTAGGRVSMLSSACCGLVLPASSFDLLRRCK